MTFTLILFLLLFLSSGFDSWPVVGATGQPGNLCILIIRRRAEQREIWIGSQSLRCLQRRQCSEACVARVDDREQPDRRCQGDKWLRSHGDVL